MFSLTWTPEGYDPDAGIPYDENAINEAYMSDFENTATFPVCSLEVNTTIEKVTYAATSSKKIYFDGERCKFLGAPGGFDADGLPTDRYASFKITMPGTVYYKLIASNKGNDDTNVSVALVLTKGDTKEVVFIDNSIADLTSSADVRSKQVTADMLTGSTSSAVVYVFSNNKNTNLYQIGFEPEE